MLMWVIYYNTSDYPDKFVARKWIGGSPTDDFLVTDTIEEARAKVPSGLVCINRYPQDDPVIVETWL